MLAHRDQENLIHSRQTAAASKTFGQNSNSYLPRTPRTRLPRTPFKFSVNDENHPLSFGKKPVQDVFGHGENTKLTDDTFQTPLQTRNRAPLGMKTTNAKARGLQTPAPLTTKPDRTNKKASTLRGRRATHVLQQNQRDAQSRVSDGDVPDIEYMPPKPKELPDIPDDITYDTSFPQFRPKNMALGLESVYGNNEIGPDGLTQRERKFREDSIACDRMVEEEIMRQMERISFNDSSGETEGDYERPKPKAQATRKVSASKRQQVSTISTIRSRSAVAALSGAQSAAARSRPAPVPKPRVATTLLGLKSQKSPASLPPTRSAAAAARSRSTVGYSKGRRVLPRLQENEPAATEPTRNEALSSKSYLSVYRPPTLEPEISIRDRTTGYFDESEPAMTEEEEDVVLYGDEEEQNFQLTL